MVFPLIAAGMAYFAPQALLGAAGFTGAGIGAGTVAAAVQVRSIV